MKVDRNELPLVIQGGMGIAVSGWKLANAVARTGQLGVVSGTALDLVYTRLLADGDPDGHVRRAFAAFPDQSMAGRVLERWFRPEGRNGAPYPLLKNHSVVEDRPLAELTMLANFAEVWLGKEGHSGLVGVNYLEKVQLPFLPSVYGAMLAGVDYVLMGAGIPANVPKALDQLTAGEAAEYPVTFEGPVSTPRVLRFDPASYFTPLPEAPRPMFLAIISSHVLGSYLAKNPVTRPDGFIVERHIAGGHNAPPRGKGPLDDLGQPVYGPRDEADLALLGALGLPFWMAGGYGHPEQVREAIASGAAGVQVGSAFAICEESGLEASLRQTVIREALDGSLNVRTDALASPSGYPFKVASVGGTLSESEFYELRERVCDLGYLRNVYEREDGVVGYRCAAEPRADYLRKGGKEAELDGRKCLCNALMADIGLGQVRADGRVEQPLVTMGDDGADVVRALDKRWPGGSWPASAIIDYLLDR